MIVRAGTVMVAPEDAGTLAAALAEFMRREQIFTPELGRLLLELRAAADGGRTVDTEPGEWVDVREAARRLGLSPRTVRNRLDMRRLTGRKEGSRWLVRIT